ncbi:DUF6221 family protein [Streptomyces virginiae]|uniref:DUF6221 family protein n=1 Tax=Streptomyces virginiae TaxID=1961 RepID=UPI0036B25E00
MTAELINFLRDRLSVEEHVAREATVGPWRNAGTSRHHEDVAGPCEAVFAAPPDRGCTCIARTGARGDRQAMVDAEHIARHNPERVLAEVEVKRRLIALHEPVILRGGGGAEYFNTTRVCRSCEPPKQFPETAYPCQTLRLLALPYADHPYYQQAWRP